MSKSMSVQFKDGTSHTYDEVPDDVTQEQLNARAQQDFSDKEIAGVNEGAHPEAAPAPTAEQQGAVEPSLGTKIVGAAQTAANVAGENWKPLATAGGAILGYNKAKAAIAPIAEAWTNSSNVSQFNTLMNNYSKMNHDIRQYTKMGQPVPQDLLDAQKSLGQQIQAAQSKIPGAPGAGPAAPGAAQAGAATAEQPGMIQRAGQYVSQMGKNVASKVAPIGEAIAQRMPSMAALGEGALNYGGKALRIAGSAPAVGAQLMLHSGGLNEGEDEELKKIQAYQDAIAAGKIQPNAVNSGFTQQLSTLSKKKGNQ